MKHINSLLKKVGKGQGGFTLIELLIVIVILGIIAAVVALNVGGFLGTGTKEAAMTEKDTVQTAVLGAMADNGAGALQADDDALGPTDTTIKLAIGATGTDVNLLPATGKAYLTGAIQGSYNVDITGAIDSALYPAASPQFQWTPTYGWEPYGTAHGEG